MFGQIKLIRKQNKNEIIAYESELKDIDQDKIEGIDTYELVDLNKRYTDQMDQT